MSGRRPRGGTPADAAERQALIFFAEADAEDWAASGRRVRIFQYIDGVQSCFCISRRRSAGARGSLLGLDPDGMVEQLAQTRHRLPDDVRGSIIFPPGLAAGERESFTAAIEQAFAAAAARRRELEVRFEAAIARLPVRRPRPGDAHRVFVRTSRFGPLIQFNCRSLARELEEAGCAVRIAMEAHDWERLSRHHWLQEIVAFAPTVRFSINREVARECPDGCVQVQWWQDPTEELLHGRLAWRPSDIVYCVDRTCIGTLLERQGLARERIAIQGQCVDQEVFTPTSAPTPRPRRIVFVGSLYEPALPAAGAAVLPAFAATMQARIDDGVVLDTPAVAAIAAAAGVPLDLAWTLIWVSILKRRVVEWACSLAASGWEIAIYGMGWEVAPAVAPFHRGTVQPGPELARVYQEASHAIAVNPMMINHQRLAEMACSGCIPLVYDCRTVAEPPHWDAECLFFRTRAELLRAVQGPPPAAAPRRIAEVNSFRAFARRILADAAAADL